MCFITFAQFLYPPTQLQAALEGEIGKLRAQLAAQIMELKELMDIKLQLTAEIATYGYVAHIEAYKTR